MTERTYDYPSKNAVREAWMDFLPDFHGTHAHGLYLPGPENLELPGYLKKGCLSQHLVGCEHNKAAAFRLARRPTPTRLVGGNIRDGVELIESIGWPRLTFANLDFDGMYDTYVEEIMSLFRVFPAATDGYLAITSYGARDDECLEQGAVNISKFHVASGHGGFLPEVGALCDQWMVVKRLVRSDIPCQHYVSREIGLLWWLALLMSAVGYQDDTAYGAIDTAFVGRIQEALEVLTSKVKILGRATHFLLLDEPQITAWFAQQPAMLWPTDLRHFLYHSQGNQPMHTWFLRICCMEPPHLPTAQEVVRQVWQLAMRAPVVYVDETGNILTSGGGKR